MENVPARTLTINPAGDWLVAAGSLLSRLGSAVRAFAEALQKKPLRGRAKARRRPPARPPEPRPSPWMEPGELPETYGRTKVVAMVVSPYLVHVYWDLSSKDRAQTGPACLRFHDTTADGSFDVNVDLPARNWYVQLWSPDKRYSIELGLQRAHAFTPLARSNPIETPRAWPVAEVGQVSGPPPSPPLSAPVAAGAVSGQPIQADPDSVHSVQLASGPPPAPARTSSGDVAPFIPSAPPPHPASALETLRRRLSELYSFRRWPRPVAAFDSAAAEQPIPPLEQIAEQSIPSLEQILNPEARADLTAHLEAQFSPGQSSGLLQNRNKPSG